MIQDRITYLVLSAMSNDYEDFEMVVREACKWAEQDGIIIARQDILRALQELISQGYAQSYVLSSTPPHVTPVDFSMENVGRIYFYVTPKGQRLVEDLDKSGQPSTADER